jgi:hypothetical protein
LSRHPLEGLGVDLEERRCFLGVQNPLEGGGK